MDIYVLVLRLVHVLAGVFWAGGVIMMAYFIEPAVKATGPEGSKFMQRLSGGRFTPLMAIAAPANVIAGLLLYIKDSAGFRIEWILTPSGIGFTIGAISGLVAFVIGFFVTRPTIETLGALGKEIQAAGKPPTSEQLTKLHGLQEKLTTASLQSAIFIVITLISMATARYW
jgi:uncharacterized membrane protein